MLHEAFYPDQLLPGVPKRWLLSLPISCDCLSAVSWRCSPADWLSSFLSGFLCLTSGVLSPGSSPSTWPLCLCLFCSQGCPARLNVEILFFLPLSLSLGSTEPTPGPYQPLWVDDWVILHLPNISVVYHVGVLTLNLVFRVNKLCIKGKKDSLKK